VKKEKMKIEKKANGKGKGKAIIGIAMAAIMLASVFVAMVPTATAVAPEVTVDKVTCGTIFNVPVDYTFTITNNDAFAQTFTVDYPVASLTAEWVGTAVPFITANIPAGGTGTFTLMLTPWAAYAPPINVPVTVTSGWSGDATTKTIGCMTPLTYNGLRNVILAPSGPYDPSNPADPNYVPPTAVLIGQDLDLSALPAAQLPAVIVGDPTSSATAGQIFQTDATGMFPAAAMTVTGTYHINPTGGTSITPPNPVWGVLGVADPTMNLDLRVGGTSVSSITQGTPLQIRFTNNLDQNDMVTLKIIDPNGNQIKSTTAPVQKFSKINVLLISQVYGVAGIDTTNWKIGRYTFQVMTDKDVAAGCGARGLDMSSNQKTLTIAEKGKVLVSVSTDKTDYQPGDIMDTTITMTNTFNTSKTVTLYWWLTIPQFDYRTVMLAQPFILPPDYNTSLIIPVPIGKWGNSAFGSVWGVGFFDKENKIIAWDTTGWNYVPTKVAQVEKSPAAIAKEITKEIGRVELPD
jgi:hypothetical protein